MKSFTVQDIKQYLNDPYKQIYIISGALILISVLLSIVAVFSCVNIIKFSNDTQLVRQKIETLRKNLALQKEMEKKIKLLEEDFAVNEECFFSEKDITALLKNIAEVASKTEVKIGSLTPYDTRETEIKDGRDKYFKELPVKLTAKCGFHDLGRFIDILEEGKYLIEIKDVKINANKDTPYSHDVVMMFNVYVSINK
ncbi:hypothetical protein OMAG_000306 [Candidatus Omnitrophus magneticus]|uniref:Tfp pilus assembly protein PilO n=1 Tax=Candidatus Omnitrophus magneticus TaxID=1609969 RepID=A0A0F0CW92_9BACT|nr:hypothetical protein OMAG_000306 [Candidatus Omnitrophus magneticus]